MKEQTAELANECGFDVDKTGTFGNYSEMRRLEKFAELIVQECVTVINYGIDHTEYPHPNDVEKSMIEMKAQMWCRDAIKEHFGIE